MEAESAQERTSARFRIVQLRPLECLREGAALVGDQYWLFVGIIALAIVISWAVPMGILMGPMFGGIYLCYRQREREGRVIFATLFKGFDHFVHTLIVTMIEMGASLALMIPWVILFGGLFGLGLAVPDGPPPDWTALPSFLLVAGLGFLSLYPLAAGWAVASLFLFTLPLVVDGGLTALDAVRTSIRAVVANLTGILLLTLVTGLIVLIALMACFLPILLVLPFVMGAYWVAYRKIFSPEGAA